MLASICCRRRRLPLALRQISAGATNRIHPNPNTVLPSNICSSSAFKPNPKPCPTTFSYLVSCGVSPAVAAVREVRIRDTNKADAVRNLLREYGFSEAQLARAVSIYPMLLTFDPDRTVRPKLDFLLLSLRFRPCVIVAEPLIISRSLEKHLVPCIDFLLGILGTEDKVRLAVSRNPRALFADVDTCMRPAVEAFRHHGLSDESIAKLLVIAPGVLIIPLHRVAEAFENLKEFSMCATDTNFLYALRIMCLFKSESWRRKMALYQSFGVSKDVLIRAFKMHPNMLHFSEETIKKKVRFFREMLKLELTSVLQRPIALSLSLEKSIKPRCAVLRLLIREGKLERKPKLPAVFLSSKRVFSKRFVLKHADDVPDVVKAFAGKIKFEGFKDRELEFFSY